MVSVQPINLWLYIGSKRNKTPKDIRRLFYLSFEDALWDLLTKKGIKKGSTLLVPSFYCGDVEKNIIAHGYKISKYQILDNLKVDKIEFLKRVNKYNPAVIVVFHPVGITSNLFSDVTWIKRLPKDTFLIEDSVHRFVNPNEVKFYKKNHFVIDSLRKVIPLQGSNIYGNWEDLDFDPPVFYQSGIYSLKVHIYWLLMVVFLSLGFYKLAEKFMITGYDLIGDKDISAPGFLLFRILTDYINFSKIYKIKERQIAIYKKHINAGITFKKSEERHMRAFPIVLQLKNAHKVLKNLRDNNLLVRFELNDSPWSKKQKIIYLPLGPYIKDPEILEICALMVKSLNHG